MAEDFAVASARLISTEGAKEAVYHALALYIGRARAWSYHDLATALTAAGHDVQPTTVSSWIASNPVDRKTPPTDVLLKLAQILGAAFTSKVLGAIGQGAHSLSAITGDPARLIAALMDGSAQFAILGIDGVYCNVDKGKLEPVADAMIEWLTPFSSKRGQ